MERTMEHKADQSLWRKVIRPAWRSRTVFFIRLAVGLIFVTQGILKYIDPNMGVNRFTKIGFSHPYFTAHFVGTFEMICGVLVLIGLATRVAAVPLLIVICTAIATTKIPELSRPNQGFWFMVSDARADLAMLMSLLFLLRAGAGSWSVDTSLVPSAAPDERAR
jgi:putative oxidoreductase